MAYDYLLKVVEKGLKETKKTKSFYAGGGELNFRIDVDNLKGNTTLQVVLETSKDGVNFVPNVMTKVFNANERGFKFVAQPEKHYRYSLEITGTSPSVDVEINVG